MYHQYIFLPLYNGFVGLMDLLPWIDVGIAVVLFTIIIRCITYPLSKSAVLTQVRMKAVEPELNKIKKEYANDKQQQGLKMMEMYKAKGIRPFSGILLLFVQLPILFALISVFYKITPEVNPEYLYSFISVPTAHLSFLGIDITQPHILLALLAAVAQYIQIKYSISARQHREALLKNGGKPGTDFASQMSHTMYGQMSFMLPILAFVSTYWLIPLQFPQASSIVAIYWATTATFTFFQEMYIRVKHLS